MGLIDVDFLEEQQTDSSEVKVISEKAAYLVQLYREMKRTEEAFEAAKKAYDSYRLLTLPTEMLMHGVTSITTVHGQQVQVNTKYYCSPNKNDADKQQMREWLIANKGQHLIKEHAVVPQEAIKQLEEAHIPFDRDINVNTNSLKAWLKGQVGASEGAAVLDINEIPNYIHFIMRDEAEVINV
jgi:hypothetical protein